MSKITTEEKLKKLFGEFNINTTMSDEYLQISWGVLAEEFDKIVKKIKSKEENDE